MTDRLLPRRLAAARAAALLGLLAAAAPARAADDRVIVSGSVYVDYWGIDERTVAARAPQSVSPEASLKVQVDIHDDLAFAAKACYSCHGIDIEHVYLDWMPKTWFNVQAGRITVPFGEYANRVDPSGHKTASAPLIWDMGRMAYGEKTNMNLGVLPQPISDTGVLVYGTKWLGSWLQTWYGVYGVAGYRGSNDLDFTSLRTVYYTDNNREPAAGARLTLTVSSENGFFGDFSLGASGMAGRYDRNARLLYAAVGGDVQWRLGPVVLRGEYALRRTDLDPNATGYRYELVDTFFDKEGWYAEIEHPLGDWLSLVYRYEELRRSGAPIPGPSALTPSSLLVRYTAGLVLTPAKAVYVKLGWEYWTDETLIGTRAGTTPFADFHSAHLGFGGAF
jgi:hypothetical protein